MSSMEALFFWHQHEISFNAHFSSGSYFFIVIQQAFLIITRIFSDVFVWLSLFFNSGVAGLEMGKELLV